MPTKDRYHRDKRPAIPRFLSEEDKKFIRLMGEGVPRPKAFREAYPNHKNVKKFMDMKAQGIGGEELRAARDRVRQHAKDKVLTKHISSALTTYQKKMDEFSDLSLNTAIELVKSARSEKVRADLAIEGMRHKVGTPVQKVAVQEKKIVHLTFDKPNEVIDAEVVDEL